MILNIIQNGFRLFYFAFYVLFLNNFYFVQLDDVQLDDMVNLRPLLVDNYFH